MWQHSSLSLAGMPTAADEPRGHRDLGAATYLADTSGPLTLTPAPTDGVDADDGAVMISADANPLTEAASPGSEVEAI